MSSDDDDYKPVMSEINKVSINATNYPTGITHMSNKQYDIALKHFCIKGSANSAYSGGYISDEMVKYVLSRGCRFLDFELYTLATSNVAGAGNDIFVSYSSDPMNLNPQVKNKEQVRFYDILSTTFASAFSSQVGDKYSSPNSDDPLFIQLRIKTDSINVTNMCDSIKKIIDSIAALGNENNIYKGTNVTKNTLLRPLLKKAIFIVGVPAGSEIGTLSTYAKMKIDSEIITNTYSGINICNNKGKRPLVQNTNQVDVDTLVEVIPDINKTNQPNPNIYSTILNYGYQITLFQYYKYDDNLINMENMFKQYNSGIVPMAYCLSYISNYSNEIECVDCNKNL